MADDVRITRTVFLSSTQHGAWNRLGVQTSLARIVFLTAIFTTAYLSQAGKWNLPGKHYQVLGLLPNPRLDSSSVLSWAYGDSTLLVSSSLIYIIPTTTPQLSEGIQA
jgi:hypothetical protein